MSLLSNVTTVAIWLSVISFALYLLEALVALYRKPTAETQETIQKARDLTKAAAPTLGDLTKLLESISKVTDSLAKAGPSLTALIASVLFLAIAAWSVTPPASTEAGKPAAGTETGKPAATGTPATPATPAPAR